MRTKQEPGAQTIKYKYFAWQARAKDLEGDLLRIASYKNASATEEIISTLDEEWRFHLGSDGEIIPQDTKPYGTREAYVEYLATIRAIASNALEVEAKCLLEENKCLKEDMTRWDVARAMEAVAGPLPTKPTIEEVKKFLEWRKETKEEQGAESQEADDDDDLPLKRPRPSFEPKNKDGSPAKVARTTP